MGFLSKIVGKVLDPLTGAGEAKKQADKAMAATSEGFRRAEETVSGTPETYDPYRELGTQSLSRLMQLLSDPSSITSDPGYQFRKKQGEETIQTSAAARGKLFGGQTLLELVKFGSDYASTELDKSINRLLPGVQTGFAATQAAGGARMDIADLQAGRGQAQARINTGLGQLAVATSPLAIFGDTLGKWASPGGLFPGAK